MHFIYGFLFFLVWIVCIAHFLGMLGADEPLSWTDILKDWSWFVIPSLVVGFFYYLSKKQDD